MEVLQVLFMFLINFNKSKISSGAEQEIEDGKTFPTTKAA